MKVMIIGIDGLDNELLTKFEKDLPNFKKLRERSPLIKLTSVFPPDSPTAWTSIYTGKNPAEHGMVFFKDPFSKSRYGSYIGNDISRKTFWDIAGKQGKKVCVLFPHLGYPVWPVNGIMIGRTTEVDIKKFDIQTWPKEISTKYDLSGLEPMTSYPVNVGDMIEPTKEVILNEVELASQLCRDFNWDLYFFYSSSLDNIQHLFWMYYDREDPFYWEGNPYENVIPDFYKFYDKNVIGRFLKIIDSDTVLIVLSDHGHAMRPAKVVNINEILRKKGFLKKKKEMIGFENTFIDKMKNAILSVIDQYRIIGKMASIFLKLFPQGLSFYTNITPIDNKSIAYLSDPSGGIKAYSYAGIKINKKIVDDSSYESLRDQIIKILLSIENPGNSGKLVEWAKRREEIYNGKYINKYPDIVFKLKEGWGAGLEINEKIFSKSRSHKLHSGNHRMETPVLLIYNEKIEFDLTKNLELMDIAPLISKFLEME